MNHVYNMQVECLLDWRPTLQQQTFKKVKVYGLVSSAKRYSPEFTQFSLDRRNYSFILKFPKDVVTIAGLNLKTQDFLLAVSRHKKTTYGA